MARNRQRGRGQILPHERDCDREGDIIGEDLLIANYEEEILATTTHLMSDGTRKDYRRRIVCMHKWLEKEHPSYFIKVFRIIPPEELKTPKYFYFNIYDRDLVYCGMNAKYIISF